MTINFVYTGALFIDTDTDYHISGISMKVANTPFIEVGVNSNTYLHTYVYIRTYAYAATVD